MRISRDFRKITGCIASVRRYADKASRSTPKLVEREMPFLGHLHMVKTKIDGEVCVQALLTETADIRSASLLPKLAPATVAKVSGPNMAIQGVEHGGAPGAGPTFPQSWWIKVLTDEEYDYFPRTDHVAVQASNAPRPPEMTTYGT